MDILLGKTLNELQEVALSIGLPKYAGKQLADWLYKKRVKSIDEMTNISIAGRKALSDKYIIGRSAPIAEAISVDGTKKYLFSVQTNSNKDSQQVVETVYIPEDDRATLCVSTQAGCKMGCKFCMTGTLGFHGQLTVSDIINQVLSIPDSERLTNIVYMGEGEPCDNIDAVLRSLEILTSSWGLGWSPHRITVSSVGYMKGLQQLLDSTDCHIAISLHNPFPEERKNIMPIENRYPLAQVLDLLKKYDFSHQRRLSFEYICFDGSDNKFACNTTPRYAKALKNILSDLDCRINLIRFHSPNPHQNSKIDQAAEQMKNWLETSITTTIRKSRGEDIQAACGMLVNELLNNNK